MSLPQGDRTTPPRVERLRRSLAAQNVDVLVAFKPEVTFYLTAFTPIIYSNPVIVIMTLDRGPVLLVNALRDELARASPWVSDVRLYGSWFGRESVAPTWDTALAVILAELGVSNKAVGIEKFHLARCLQTAKERVAGPDLRRRRSVGQPMPLD